MYNITFLTTRQPSHTILGPLYKQNEESRSYLELLHYHHLRLRFRCRYLLQYLLPRLLQILVARPVTTVREVRVYLTLLDKHA